MNENTTLTLRGRVGTDLRRRTTQSGRHTIRFRLAVSQWRVRDDGVIEDREPHWYTVRAWDRLAENAVSSIHKGDPVIVVGRPTVNAWKDDQGEVRSEMVVTAQAMGHDIAFGWTHFGKVPTPAPEASAESAVETSASSGISSREGESPDARSSEDDSDETIADQQRSAPVREEALVDAPI